MKYKYLLLICILFLYGCVAPPFMQDYYDNKYKIKERVRQSKLTTEEMAHEQERCKGVIIVLYNTRIMCQVYKENEAKQ